VSSIEYIYLCIVFRLDVASLPKFSNILEIALWKAAQASKGNEMVEVAHLLFCEFTTNFVPGTELESRLMRTK
jgi:hypothetical protein